MQNMDLREVADGPIIDQLRGWGHLSHSDNSSRTRLVRLFNGFLGLLPVCR